MNVRFFLKKENRPLMDTESPGFVSGFFLFIYSLTLLPIRIIIMTYTDYSFSCQTLLKPRVGVKE